MSALSGLGHYAASGVQALVELFFPANDSDVARAEAHRQALVDAEAAVEVSEPLDLPDVPAASAGEAGDSPAAVSDPPTTPAAGRPTSELLRTAAIAMQCGDYHPRLVDELLARSAELTDPQK